jgi:Cupin-like domain
MASKHNESAEQKRDTLTPSAVQQETQRRQLIARYIYDVWTQCGSEVNGLAAPILVDGRFDTLSNYVIEYYSDICDVFSSDHSVCAKTTEIDNVDAASLSYDNFCDNYMYRNIPVVINGLSDTWSCCNDWIIQDPATGCHVPNLSHILQCYGNDSITVHAQSVEGFQYPQQRPETSITYNMTVADYVTWWNKHQDQCHENLCCEDALLYLKDWKFSSSHPNADIYTCPQFFCDDWLNEAKNSSYKFVYLGRKGTVTALHADVLRSFSWSTNIVGTKLWYFIAPQHSHLLYDCFGTKLAYHLHADIERTETSDIDQQQNDYMSALYPGLRYARKHSFSILQQSGETIFVPSNWFHTVENIHDTLSINHNWLNGANIRKCWDYVESKVQGSRTSANKRLNTSNPNHKTEPSYFVSNVKDTIENIDDDVLLLWEIVEKKAKHYIKLYDTKCSPKQTDDLQGILFVVDEMISLYASRDLSSIAANELGKVIQLRQSLASILT